jgi:hypothetical protein
MAYGENTKIKNSSGQIIDPVQDENVTFFKRIIQILKPLSIITGGGSNRLNIDVNAVTTLPTVATVTTVTTVSTVTTATTVGTLNNLAAVGGIPGFDLMKAASRTAYNTGIRANIT